MKTLMAKFENTTRSRELPCCCPDDCGKTYRVTHLACSEGCYDCNESTVTMELVSIHEGALEVSDGEEEDEEEEALEEDEEEEVTAMQSLFLDEMD